MFQLFRAEQGNVTLKIISNFRSSPSLGCISAVGIEPRSRRNFKESLVLQELLSKGGSRYRFSVYKRLLRDLRVFFRISVPRISCSSPLRCSFHPIRVERNLKVNLDYREEWMFSHPTNEFTARIQTPILWPLYIPIQEQSVSSHFRDSSTGFDPDRRSKVFKVFELNPGNSWDPVWSSFLPNRNVFTKRLESHKALCSHFEKRKSVRRLLDITQVEPSLMRIFN